MSASAEVYVSVDDSDAKHEAGDKVDQIVEAALKEVCIPTTGSSYAVSRMSSGVIFESRGHSVSYDVFDEAFAKGIVQKLHDLDDGLDVEVYVYNLEREADNSYTTWRLQSQKEVV
jgi:hypothetical protein